MLKDLLEEPNGTWIPLWQWFLKNYPKIDPDKGYGHPTTDGKVLDEEFTMKNFKFLITEHCESGSLKTKTDSKGNSYWEPRVFRDWWLQFDIGGYLTRFDVALSQGLNQVFQELEKIDEKDAKIKAKSENKVAESQKDPTTSKTKKSFKRKRAFLKTTKTTKTKIEKPYERTKPPSTLRGRCKFPHEEAVKKAIIKICKRKNKPTKSQIPFMTEIITAFASGKESYVHPNMPKGEYKKKFGWALSTIQKLVRKYYF